MLLVAAGQRPRCRATGEVRRRATRHALSADPSTVEEIVLVMRTPAIAPRACAYAD
jgi:hypothetical protein